MRNTNIPTHVDLPTSQQLVRSTVIALATAAAILVAVILPAEYGVDPTGVGRALRLTQMGEIKMQLAKEAEADRAATASAEASAAPATTTAPAATAQAAPAATGTVQGGRSDEMTVTLEPGQGAEIKLAMAQGAKADFRWTVGGGVVNYDLHGDGGGRSTSYEKGRGLAGDSGVVEAAFDGNHGWYWRNRGASNVTVTIRTSGAYSEMKRVI